MSDRDLPVPVSLWVSGYTYRAISRKTGISTGAISNLINDWKNKVPGLEELHEISRTLKKTGAGLLEILRGARILDLLNDMSVSLEEIPQCLEYFNSIEGRPHEIATAGLHLLELEEKTGLSFQSIIEEYLEKREKCAEADKSLKTLKAERKAIREGLSDLKKLEKLDKRFRELGLTPKRVERLLASALSIEELGFTPKIAEMLASELKEVGLGPSKAAKEIARLVKEHGSLEKAVSKLSRAEKQIKTQITMLQDEVNGLKEQRDRTLKSIDKGQKALDVLEALHKRMKADLKEEYSEKCRNLEREHSEKRSNLEKEYDLKKRSLDLEISELEEKRERFQGDLGLLTEKRAQLTEAFEFVGYMTYFLTDRDKVPTALFENLLMRLEYVVERRRKGLITDWEEGKARSMIMKALIDYIGTDVVSKSEYDKLKREYDILVADDPLRALAIKQMELLKKES